MVDVEAKKEEDDKGIKPLNLRWRRDECTQCAYGPRRRISIDQISAILRAAELSSAHDISESSFECLDQWLGDNATVDEDNVVITATTTAIISAWAVL